MATIGKTNAHAASLRLNSTDAERRLWARLRNRQLGGFKFRRQVTIGTFIADFACVEAKLIVEADGGQHGSAPDGSRTAQLEALGWRVERFWNNDILRETDGVLGVILAACVERSGEEVGKQEVQEEQEEQEEPSPYPLPLAGEGDVTRLPLAGGENGATLLLEREGDGAHLPLVDEGN